MKKLLIEILIVLIIGYTIINYFNTSIREERNNYGIKINQKYLFSYTWNYHNPFKKINIDTVQILNIKDGYIQYKVFNSGQSWIESEILEDFKNYIKPLNYKR